MKAKSYTVLVRLGVGIMWRTGKIYISASLCYKYLVGYDHRVGHLNFSSNIRLKFLTWGAALEYS